MYLDRTPSLLYNVFCLGGKESRSMSPCPCSPESLSACCSSSLAKPFPLRGFTASLVTISKQTSYKSCVLISFRTPLRLNPRLFYYFRMLAEEQGAVGALSKIPESHCEASNASDFIQPPDDRQRLPLPLALCGGSLAIRSRLADPWSPVAGRWSPVAFLCYSPFATKAALRPARPSVAVVLFLLL